MTIARAASDTFAGIRPGDAPGFIAAQALGAAAATLLFRWLVPKAPARHPYLVSSEITPNESSEITPKENHEDGTVRLRP